MTQLNINESLSLECNVTLTRGIVGNVSITWKANNTTKNVTIKEISPEQVSYIDHYQYSSLGLSHNNTVYYCEAVISNSTLLKSNASIIIGKQVSFILLGIKSINLVVRIMRNFSD